MTDENEIVFTAEPRSYVYRGKPYRSVTDYIGAWLGNPFAMVRPSVMRHAIERGNAVHSAIELMTAGRLDWATVDPRIEGYVRAAEKFHRENPGTIVYTEKRMVSPELGVAGTPDIVMFIRGYRSLVDYKTSQQMSPRMRLQTVGYQKLHNATYPKAQIVKRYGLRLQPDGNYKLVPHDDPDDGVAFDVMLAELRAHDWAEKWKQKYK